MHNVKKDNLSNNDKFGQITQIGAGWLGSSSILAPMVEVSHVTQAVFTKD